MAIYIDADGTTRTVADTTTGRVVRVPMPLRHPDRSRILWTRATHTDRLQLYDARTAICGPTVTVTELGVSWRPAQLPPAASDLTTSETALTAFVTAALGARTVILDTRHDTIGPVYTVRALVARR